MNRSNGEKEEAKVRTMDETPQPKQDEREAAPLSLPRKILRWWLEYPATAAWLSLIGLAFVIFLDYYTVGLLPAYVVGPAFYVCLLSYACGFWAIRRKHPSTRERILLRVSLVAAPFLVVAIGIPTYLRIEEKKPSAYRAASRADVSVTGAIAYAKEKGVYPTSLKVLRESQMGYDCVPDTHARGGGCLPARAGAGTGREAAGG